MIPAQEREPTTQASTERYFAGDKEIIAILGIAQTLYQERKRMDDELADVNIKEATPIISPLEVVTRYPLSETSKETVKQSRAVIEGIIENPRPDSKLIVVTGPCSIHSIEAALKYAKRVARWREQFGDDLEIVMRCYFEKPRTTIGWEGLIDDPKLDKSYDKDAGLLASRELICLVTDMGVPVATELVNTDTPQYLDDGISLGAIGARTVESQVHRKLASGVSFPVGNKNGTGGSIDIAVDAIEAESHSHRMDGTDMVGRRTRYTTNGNKYGFLILRGSKKGPNFSPEHVAKAGEKLAAAGQTKAIMVDCSHKNKLGDDQSPAVKAVAQQVAAGNASIIGVMIESNLVEGKQVFKHGKTDPHTLNPGQSITDYCESADQTEQHLRLLSQAVAERRSRV